MRIPVIAEQFSACYLYYRSSRYKARCSVDKNSFTIKLKKSALTDVVDPDLEDSQSLSLVVGPLTTPAT
jgi:hypothetical protein